METPLARQVRIAFTRWGKMTPAQLCKTLHISDAETRDKVRRMLSRMYDVGKLTRTKAETGNGFIYEATAKLTKSAPPPPKPKVGSRPGIVIPPTRNMVSPPLPAPARRQTVEEFVAAGGRIEIINQGAQP